MSGKRSDGLAEGVYEHLITERLAARLAMMPVERVEDALGEADAHIALARHLGGEVERVLASFRGDDRVERARMLSAKLLDHLATLVETEADALHEQRPSAPARRLLALHRGAVPVRPTSPLATSTLLTRNRAEPSLGHELAAEIADD